MAGPAPTELQYTDQQETDFYKEMADSVEQKTGQPTTPASLKPEDETALGKIREELGNFARYHGGNLTERVSGKATDADVMTSGGNEAVTIAQKRGLTMRLLHKLGLRKAA